MMQIFFFVVDENENENEDTYELDGITAAGAKAAAATWW
jgi:hypothetical protein